MVKFKKYNIALTTGSFDMLHFGHLNIFKKAKKTAKTLVVGVSTDKLIKKHKGINPVIGYKERVALIKELKCVDRVVKQSKLVDINQFKRLHIDIFVLGDDWKNRYDNEGINWLRDNDKIIFIPYTKHLSTSKIKNKIIRNSYKIIEAQLKRKNFDE